MFRDFQNFNEKPANSMYKASEEMITGMGAVVTDSTKELSLPDAETADVVIVDKERIANTGVYAVFNSQLPDYDSNFTNIAKDEMVKFHVPVAGEVFGTDQYVETGLVDGVRMAVNTSGKWVKATTAESNFVYTGTRNDAGHTLARIKVVSNFAKNA